MEEEEEYFEFPYSFWGVEIGPDKTVPIEYEEDAYLLITNACIGEIPADIQDKRNVISLHCKTVDLDQYNEETQEAPETTTDTTICTLIPGEVEHLMLSNTLTKLNSDIKLTNKGPCTVYVSGYYVFNGDDDYEEEEEEEEEEEDAEEANDKEDKEEETNKKLLAFIQRHQKKVEDQEKTE